MNDVVSDIDNASNEQSGGLDQISRALTQMDEVTQQNSALVEENAATARTLEEQARALAADQRIAFFKPRAATAHVQSADEPGPRLDDGAAAVAPRKKQPAIAAGPARRMQGALAVAYETRAEY